MLTLQRVGPLTPIGTLVVVLDDSGRPKLTQTRSEVWSLDKRTWLVKLDGIRGGYDVNRVYEVPEV